MPSVDLLRGSMLMTVVVMMMVMLVSMGLVSFRFGLLLLFVGAERQTVVRSGVVLIVPGESRVLIHQ